MLRQGFINTNAKNQNKIMPMFIANDLITIFFQKFMIKQKIM